VAISLFSDRRAVWKHGRSLAQSLSRKANPQLRSTLPCDLDTSLQHRGSIVSPTGDLSVTVDKKTQSA
jgi:hypothetical protein